MDERPASLAATIEEAATALGRAARRELRHAVSRLILGLFAMVLALAITIGCAVAGVMRLGDALARFCGRWFGDQALGDAVIGLTLLAVSLLIVLSAWLWTRR